MAIRETDTNCAWPSRMAPNKTKIEARTAAVQNLSILAETAEPNTLDASFAPRDQPKKTPPKIEIIRRASLY